MTRINLSHDKNYLTQLNNKISPHSTCNVTSAIMALYASRIGFDYPKDMQPEDYLASILISKESYERMTKLYPWAVRDGYEPYEVHAMLQWGVNKLVGKEVDKFTTKSSFTEIIKNLIKGYASLVSTRMTNYGHIVCVVGFESNIRMDILNRMLFKEEKEVDASIIENFIFDDPYGNYLSSYTDRNGNNIKLPYSTFDDLTKEYNHVEKWAHLFYKYT